MPANRAVQKVLRYDTGMMCFFVSRSTSCIGASEGLHHLSSDHNSTLYMTCKVPEIHESPNVSFYPGMLVVEYDFQVG